MSRKEQNQRHYQKHKEKIAAQQKEWRNKNPKRFAFLMQRRHAKERGIEFQFEYEQWVDWWGEDFANRGCKSDQLVMARKGDTGPYHPDNVYKQTAAENIADSNRPEFRERKNESA